MFCLLVDLRLVVSTSANDWLERIVSKMICNVFTGTLNPTHYYSLGASLIKSESSQFL